MSRMKRGRVPEGPVRIEHDSLGDVEVPASRLWGAQTERSLDNFPISSERMPLPVVHALAEIKRAAAQVNVELGALPAELGDAIAAVADEILAGEHDAEFPLVVWQTGSGTQTNMNVNEVIANRASEILGGARGSERLVHPNDHVNKGQSSNDTFPSALRMAAARALIDGVVPSVERLAASLEERARAHADVVKIGRTHLQDAVPLTLGQEIGAWAAQLHQAVTHLRLVLPHLTELPLGGTAVGTGLGAHPEFGRKTVTLLAERTGLPLTSAPNRFEAISAEDGLVFAHGALKALAVSLMKIAGDVRLLASGPRAGIGEIRIPENEPGSSIMPGKVNPTQCEALVMLCAQVLGNDVTVGIAGAGGQFQLNACRPVLAHAFLQSCRLLADGCDSFRVRCASGIVARPETIAKHLEQSLMLVTALAPHIGYDAAARIAKKAHEDGTTLREAAEALGVVSGDDFDRWVRPEEMVGEG